MPAGGVWNSATQIELYDQTSVRHKPSTVARIEYCKRISVVLTSEAEIWPSDSVNTGDVVNRATVMSLNSKAWRWLEVFDEDWK
jgi:hypothetical protein